MRFLGRLLQLTVLVGAFYDAIEFIKPGVSTASLTVIDLLLLVVYLFWFFLVMSGKMRLPSFFRNKALYLFIFMLLIPVVTGLNSGHLLQTVLRDARAPYYFVLSLVVISFAKDEKSLRKLLTGLLVVGAACLLLDYTVYAFRIPVSTKLGFQRLASGVVSRHFGYHSSHVLLLVCILLLVNYLFVIPDGKNGGKFKLVVSLLLFVTGLCLTLIRSLFIGMVSGLVVTVLIQKGKARWGVIFGVVLIAGFVTFLFQFASPETINGIIRIPVVERYMSIVDPSVTTEGSRQSAEGRLEAVSRILNNGIREHPFFGVGYGEFRKPRNENDLVDPFLGLISHSTMSFMFYRTGYVGTSVLLVCLLVFFVRGVTSFKLSSKNSWYRLGYGTTSAFLVAIFVTGTGGNMMYGSERFSPLIAMMIGLLLSKQSEQRHVDPIRFDVPPLIQTKAI